MKKSIFQIFIITTSLLIACNPANKNQDASIKKTSDIQDNPFGLDTQKIIDEAEALLKQEPITITKFKAERSKGGIHDYYSEGLYWWENPEDPDGPYIRKDGVRNPNNFRDHKNALRDFCLIVPTLTAAYQLTEDDRFANHAIKHIQAWFNDPDTKMNPRLLYAQAIKGISTGRGIGIIDTVRLINVAMSIMFLEEKKLFKNEQLVIIKKWFNDYSEWLTTHPYGLDERDNNNNHSTWWGAQVSAYARVAERDDILKICQTQFKAQLDIQMAANGNFPNEISRTKPFHYMNYNLRAWTSFALLASTPEENLWEYKSKNGSIQKAIGFMFSFYQNLNTWTYQSEMEKEIHMSRNDFLLHAYWGLGDKKYVELWEQLEKSKDKYEAREEQLVLWVNKMSR